MSGAAGAPPATAPPGQPLDLEAFARALANPPVPPAASWRPWLVRLTPGQFPRLTALCRTRHITLLDTIDRQLSELAAVRFPGAQRQAQRRRFVQDVLDAAGNPACCGVWVYVPWDAKIAHLLDAEAYFEVITNRNRDKITRAEQQRLRTKRVAVVGLSVGAEAAVTIAQEHLCGAIVLADFDRLDLSNLNRLQAGFDDLGQAKPVLAARRIAKIDPYLDVTVFEHGVTADTLETFLAGVDLVVEECDDLRMKFDIRRVARARRINVVFAADERGFLSVEPYANEPDLDPFHGRIRAPQPPRDAFPTPLAYFGALTEWLGGWDAISERSRQSLEQVGSALAGYPQLASEARYAAGQLGNVVRRLLLGEPLAPFMGHLALDDAVMPARRTVTAPNPSARPKRSPRR